MTGRDFKIEFETLVKEVVVPIFQGLEFKKNGNNFYREINGIGQAFNIQQSQWNSKDDKTFVFNLGLIDKESYSEIYNKELPKELRRAISPRCRQCTANRQQKMKM